MAYHWSFPTEFTSLFSLCYSRNKAPLNHYYLLHFIPWLTDAICLLYVSNNYSIISWLFYLRVVFTWHLLMYWTTSMQASRDTLHEAGFDMRKHLIEIFSRQSSQTYLLLWSSPQIVKQCIGCTPQFTHFSSQHIVLCGNMLIMYSIAIKCCCSVYIKCVWAK